MTYQRIRDMRVDHDLTQKDIAEKLGLHTTQYQVYERGEVKIPIEFFIDLARLYNVSIDYLTDLTNQPRTLDGKPYQVTGKNVVTINAPVKGNINIHQEE